MVLGASVAINVRQKSLATICASPQNDVQPPLGRVVFCRQRVEAARLEGDVPLHVPTSVSLPRLRVVERARLAAAARVEVALVREEREAQLLPLLRVPPEHLVLPPHCVVSVLVQLRGPGSAHVAVPNSCAI